MATKDLGLVTAYGYALEGGYTGTEDDFKYLLANLPSKQELLATFKRKTLSGSIVTFTDGADGVPVQALAAQIEPVQAGSGDPSPTNVRPITGWTAVNVIVSPTTTASDGTTTTTALGRTVYGGTVDVVTGVLTVTHQMDTYTGDSVTSVSSASGVQFARIVASNASPGTQVKCDRYAPSSVAASGHITWVSAAQQVVRIFDSRFTDAATAKSILNENPVHYCYPLTTPQTYALTAQEVSTLLGLNNIWADTGDIDVTYRVDPTLGV